MFNFSSQFNESTYKTYKIKEKILPVKPPVSVAKSLWASRVDIVAGNSRNQSFPEMPGIPVIA